MSILDTTKFVERLRQTLKDVKSLGVGMKSPNEKFDYLFNRCTDIVRDYDVDYSNALEEFWGEKEKECRNWGLKEKEKAEDKTYE
tara:strand:- start:583 stop:837 length:255 start_codon:yes stop_codon:yes gene_type:complete